MTKKSYMLALLGSAVVFLCGCAEENKVRLEHFALNVSADTEQVAQWYCDALDMKIQRKAGAPYNTRFVSDAQGNMMIEFYNAPGLKARDFNQLDPGQFHIAFMADNITAVCEKMQTLGAEVISRPKTADSGDEFAMLRDPWGVPVQLVTRRKVMLPHR